MAKNLNPPPLDFALLDGQGHLNEQWRQWFADTFQSLDGVAGEAGVILPNLTTAQRDDNDVIDQANIPTGLTIFNTSTSKAQTWDGAAWQDLY